MTHKERLSFPRRDCVKTVVAERSSAKKVHLNEAKLRFATTKSGSLLVLTQSRKRESILLLVCLILLFAFNFQLSALTSGTFFPDGNKDKKSVALTFDDGPGGFTKEILDILDQYKVKATFFMSGEQVELRPHLAKEVAARGHEIADHTFNHINFYAFEKKYGIEKTKSKIREEMGKSKKIIEKVTGITPQLCRMPNGYYRPWLKEIAMEMNYVLVNWTFGEDWQNVSTEKMTRDYLQHLRPGSILLLHDGGKNRKKTVEILPRLIQEGRNKNLSFSTASDIIQ